MDLRKNTQGLEHDNILFNFKKEDLLRVKNYCCIYLLDINYKVLSLATLSILKKSVRYAIVGEY